MTDFIRFVRSFNYRLVDISRGRKDAAIEKWIVFGTRFVFNDEATFHESEEMNPHNVPIWGSTTLRTWIEHELGSRKGNSLCNDITMSMSKTFALQANCITCLDMLQILLFQ
ncbi:hypothetical protein NPIL_475971 [Nephila pilipes]|uniref:Uncharacterized protein n=1 Tax=Nephila pilipes TaxID=299642 RepID=A0A8X6N798_NEPPI|nr:hypothetical protein NPIL_475971 [Nephila pilipes]